jgi:neutral ceramidase
VAKDANHFYAGASSIAITPPLGTILGVDMVSHYARFIHDPVHVKALVFRDENETIAIVVVDICIMGTDFMNDIKVRIQKQTGIHPEKILLSSTHNHATGDVVGLLGGAADISYRNKLPDLIVRAVHVAKEKLRPAKIASGSVDVPEYVLCRRYRMKKGYVAMNPITGKPDHVKTNPFGAEHLIEGPVAPTDPGLSFLAVKGTDERWIAVLGNYSLHYVGDWHVDSVTADFFGEFSRRIKEKLHAEEDFVGMMSNGTSGDINIWEFMHPDRFPKEDLAKSKLIGEALAQKAFEGLLKAQWQANPTIAVQFEELEFAIRKPTKQELETATKTFMEKGFDNLNINEESINRIYAREQLLLNEYPDTCISPVQAIKIGNLIIGALGGEFFAETGLLLKKSVTDNNYFTICLANAYGGYIPPAHEMERGGYETWRARSSFMEATAEEKIRNVLVRMMNNF